MKKGFTLMELLAVIIVLGVISIIAVNVITNNIETTKKKTFEVNAIGLLEAAKEYVTKEMENNDFPEEGIEAKNLNMKNNPFISGIVRRNEQDQIILENVTDGKYCVNGVRSNLEITEGNCEKEDDTAPTLKLKELKTKRTSAQIMIKTQDNGSGISYYEYCVNEKCEKVEKNGSKDLIKEAITINSLEPNKEYVVKVRVVNGKETEDKTKTETIKEIKVKTTELDEPTFKISSSTHATIKELIITYPSVEEGYVKKYKKIKLNSENKEEIIEENEVQENEVKLDITEFVTIEAYVQKGDETIVSNSIKIIGIDLDGPKVNVVIPDIDSWSKTKKVTIEAQDEGVGLALRPYTYDGGKTWSKNNETELNASQKLNIKVRDRLGNINKKFTINGETECCVDCEGLCGLNKIDSEGPQIKYEIIEGTKQTNDNEWYTSSKVVIKVTVVDKIKEIEENNKEVIKEGGIGVDPNTVSIKVENTTNKKDTAIIEKVSDTEYTIKLEKNGEYDISLSAKDLLGNSSKNETVTIKKDDFKPTISAKSTLKDYLSSELNKNITTQFNSTYGVSKGKIVCKDIKTNTTVTTINDVYNLGKSTRDVECTITGNNGLYASAKTSFRNYYAAIPHVIGSYDCNCRNYDCNCSTYSCSCRNESCNCRNVESCTTKTVCQYEYCCKWYPPPPGKDVGPCADTCCFPDWEEIESCTTSQVCDTCQKCSTCKSCDTCTKCDTCYNYDYRCDYGGTKSNNNCYY